MDENQIKKEFEKLHQFLRDEEEKQIRSLHKEKVRQDGKLKSRIKELSKQISDLSEKMAAVWQDMEAENITFLQVQNKYSTIHMVKSPSESSNLMQMCLIIKFHVCSTIWLSTNCFYFSFRITAIH